MWLDSALIKSRARYISAQKISTLFDLLDERAIASGRTREGTKRRITFALYVKKICISWVC
jgi:hypothetical protein